MTLRLRSGGRANPWDEILTLRPCNAATDKAFSQWLNELCILTPFNPGLF